jgi:hypothetical protein
MKPMLVLGLMEMAIIRPVTGILIDFYRSFLPKRAKENGMNVKAEGVRVVLGKCGGMRGASDKNGSPWTTGSASLACEVRQRNATNRPQERQKPFPQPSNNRVTAIFA